MRVSIHVITYDMDIRLGVANGMTSMTVVMYHTPITSISTTSHVTQAICTITQRVGGREGRCNPGIMFLHEEREGERGEMCCN
jgi:hypothetical protein